MLKKNSNKGESIPIRFHGLVSFTRCPLTAMACIHVCATQRGSHKLGKVNWWEAIFLLWKITWLQLVSSLDEVTVLLTSLISGLSLVWDAFSLWRAPLYRAQPWKPSYKYMCMLRKPREKENGSIHSAVLLTKALSACTLPPLVGQWEGHGHQLHPSRLGFMLLPLSSRMTAQLLGTSGFFEETLPTYPSALSP